MEIKIVKSDVSPNSTQNLQNKTLVNFDVEEINEVIELDGEETTKTIYQYNQISLPQNATEDKIAKAILKAQQQLAQEYLDNTGWVWEKYNRNVIVLKNMTNEEFLEKYNDIIYKQEECREIL